LGWLGVFLGCAGLWGVETLFHRSRVQAETEQRQRKELRSQLSDHVLAGITYLKMTRQQLEERLNGGRPFARLPDAAAQIPRYRWDPAALGPQFIGWQVELTFRHYGDGGRVFEELISEKTLAPPVRYHNPAATQASAELETTRHVVLIAGLGTWFVALMTIFLARPWRRQIAQFCLAGALVAAVAWSVNPARTWTRAGLVAPLPLGIASAGLVGLLALVLPARPPQTRLGSVRLHQLRLRPHREPERHLPRMRPPHIAVADRTLARAGRAVAGDIRHECPPRRDRSLRRSGSNLR